MNIMGTVDPVPCFVTKCLEYFDIFQSGPKCWNNRPTLLFLNKDMHIKSALQKKAIRETTDIKANELNHLYVIPSYKLRAL